MDLHVRGDFVERRLVAMGLPLEIAIDDSRTASASS